MGMGQDMKEGHEGFAVGWGGGGELSLLWKSREPRREIYISEVEVVILDIWPRVVRSTSKSSKSGSVRVCTRMAALTLSQARPSGTQFLSHSSLIQGPDTLKISLLSMSVQGQSIATHSSILAWRIPWTEESGRLWSVGSQRVRHDWNNLAAAAARKILGDES